MKKRVVLGIETSGETCRVARLEVTGNPQTAAEILLKSVITERNYSGDASRHSEMLWSLLEGVLSGQGNPKSRREKKGMAPLSAVDLIAVSIGPGSFTGLRVGLATAKVFAHFGNIPLVGVPTMEAAAEDAAIRTGKREVLCALDARRGEVYASRFRRSGKFLSASGGIRICQIEEARRGLPEDVLMATEPPRAAVIAALGLARFLAGKCDDPRTLVPVYVRRPEAVERRLRGLK